VLFERSFTYVGLEPDDARPASLRNIGVLDSRDEIADLFVIWAAGGTGQSLSQRLESELVKQLYHEGFTRYCTWEYGINPLFNPRRLSPIHPEGALSHLDACTLMHTSSENKADKCICCGTSVYQGTVL
jgi:hypothetical protein